MDFISISLRINVHLALELMMTRIIQENANLVTQNVQNVLEIQMKIVQNVLQDMNFVAIIV